MVGHVAAVADRPDHQRSAAHDVACREHAVHAGHHRLVIDAQRAPAGDGQVVRAEQPGQLLRIVTQRLDDQRSEEHTSELQSLMRISYAVFCLKKKTIHTKYIAQSQTALTITNSHHLMHSTHM